ncbi:MAG TPA: MMPL family transporter [Acidimicrobiales bacterium]|nr:MMPL family transporter [Acidimicrobiales bacterium]
MVVGFWVLALFVGNGVLAGAGGASTDADFSLPNVESKRGTDILEDSFGGQGAGFGGSIVFKADQGVDDPEVKAAMEKLFGEIADVDGIIRVASPYDEGGERQIAAQGANADKIAYAPVDFGTEIKESDLVDIGKTVRDDVDAVKVDGLQVEIGGAAFAEFEAPSSEALGVAFAIFILILAFGSVLAMGLPIGVALAGIGAGTVLAGFISFVIHPPSFASIFGVMIGLGVGIDYALFIVTRYRENLHNGYDIRQSISIALDTAGRAVLFAGTTVVISLLGMVVMGLSFVTGLAVACATVVAATMVASVTLLPALLGFAGASIEVTRRRGLVAAALLALGLVGAGLGIAPLAGLGFGLAFLLVLPGLLAAVAHLIGRKAAPVDKVGNFLDHATPGVLMKEVDRGSRKPLRETTAYRWSRVIQHRPWPAVVVGVVVLLFLATPILGLQLGFSDEGTYPEDTTTRKAYDLLADGFGPGYNGALMLVAELPDGASEADFQQILDAVEDDPGVAQVNPPFVSDDGSAVAAEVLPTTSPQDRDTGHLVHRLRDEVIPAASEGTDIDVAVSGAVAINTDFAEYLSQRLLYFLAAVLVLSFLLLMVVFRSVLVPLKAVVMNLLSIGAAYGVIVAGFQWGWLGGILGFDKAPIEAWIPMMLFAIVFGLSMDYEVFLLSRVKEEWLRTGDSRTSVADGLAATARVITAAALIMVFVFGAFLLEPDRVTKLMGVGLATAVLLDASIVRMLLVPATMELLGDKNWWIPKWLDRILPNIDVEGHHEEPPAGETKEESELQPV